MRRPPGRDRVLRHRRVRPADGRRSWVSVSSVNYGLVRKNAQDSLHGACPIVASFGGRDRFLRAAPQRLEQALDALGIEHDITVYLAAGHAFLHEPESEPGNVADLMARLTPAGYHEASAHDARPRIDLIWAAIVLLELQSTAAHIGGYWTPVADGLLPSN
jgi:acetyl esterase/lipase